MVPASAAGFGFLFLCLVAIASAVCPSVPVSSEIELRAAVADQTCSTIELLGGAVISLTAPIVVNRTLTMTSSGDGLRATLSGAAIPTNVATSDPCSKDHRMLQIEPPYAGAVVILGVILADTPGGAVVVASMGTSTVRFQFVDFSRNGQLGRTRGGAICSHSQGTGPSNPAVQSGTLQVTSCRLTSNFGGAVDLDLIQETTRQVIAFSASLFQYNTASRNGGGVAIRATNAAVSISESCEFKFNVAQQGAGGGLYLWLRGNVALTIADGLFQSNTAISGGGIFTASLCQVAGQCPGETVKVTNTKFTGNVASAGAAVFVNSAGSHVFSEVCNWEANLGLEQSSGVHVPSRGAGIYAGSFSVDIEIDDAKFKKDTADLSTEIALSPYMYFPGTLMIKNTLIAGSDNRTVVMAVEYAPQVNVTISNSTVTGTVVVGNAATITTASSAIANFLVQSGGTLHLLDSLATRTTANLTVAACLANAPWKGPTQVCRTNDASGLQALGLQDLQDNFSWVGADSNWRPYAPESFEVVFFQLHNIAPSAPQRLTFTTSSKPVDPSHLQVAIIVDTSSQQVCGGKVVTVDCGGDHHGTSWLLVGLLIACGVLLAMIGFGKFHCVYRSKAVPGHGMAGLPGVYTHTCYHCLTCSACYAADIDPLGDLEQEQACLRDAPGEDNIALEVAEHLVSLGYGTIAPNEVTHHGSIGSGNFGDVMSGVLDRRGRQPPRRVAIKELKDVDRVHDLVMEGTLMHDIRPHLNVAFLFGMTQSPYSLVTQLIPEADELHNHLMWLIAVETTGEMRLVAVLRLTMEATRGLIHLHKHDIVHCDIAPRNILVSNSRSKTLPQRATVNDLGLARKVGSKHQVEFSGDYDRFLASPENHGMIGVHGFPGDVFQLGCTLWEVLTMLVGGFCLYFEQGQGILWPRHDIHGDEIPDTLITRIMLTTRKTRGATQHGFRVLYEAVQSYHHDHEEEESHMLHTFRLAKELTNLVFATLLKDPEQRPTMTQVHDRLQDLYAQALPTNLPGRWFDPL
eukprot:TRINITY_DN469_c0_g2_i12.p1 TRINITY_DN469_c0_g2~~TRINITY_DN469_c0_g2_i12.p1  ORF type:complete len:1026 (-),score=183.84 TRINITY_DN469_c0_g2_i12:654-3731(-)